MNIGYKQFTAVILALHLSVGPLYSAGLSIDISRNLGGASVTASSAGIDVVNISATNNRGLSHNYFTDYNVNQNGLILNNSFEHVETVIGGAVNGNPNLEKSTANVILNEVTSTNPTLIKGVTEVAGSAADVIVANPNGIAVSNGTFVNTPKATLTTGTPMLRDGFVDSFNVEGGSITIEDGGLRNEGNLQLSGANIEINSPVIANELALLGGKGIVNYRESTISSNGEGGEQLVIDSSAMGGMYAKRISIIVDEKGAGVNLGAEVVAGLKGFSLDTQGLVVLNDIRSLQDVNIDAEVVRFKNAEVSADKGFIVKANAFRANDSLFSTGENMVVTITGVPLIDQTSEMFGSNSYQSASHKSIQFYLQNRDYEDEIGSIYSNHSTFNAGDNLRFSADKSIINTRGSTIMANGDVDINAVMRIMNYGQILARSTLTLNSNDGVVNQGVSARLEGDKDLYIGGRSGAATAFVRNIDGTIKSVNGGIVIVTDKLENRTSEVLEERTVTDNDHYIRVLMTQNFDKEITPLHAATISAKYTVYIADGSEVSTNATGISNTRGVVKSGYNVYIQNQGDIVNSGGQISANKNVTINSVNGAFTNESLMQKVNLNENTYSYSNYTYFDGYTHAIGATGIIEGNDNVKISADKGVTFLAAMADAGKDLTLYSENGDISLRTKALYGRTGAWNNRFESLQNRGSTLSAGNNVNFVAINENIDIEASNILVGYSLSILGKKSINISAVNDRTYSYYYNESTKTEYLVKETTTIDRREVLKETVQTASLKAGGDVILLSDGDISVEAVKIDASNIEAQSVDSDVNIVAKDYINDSFTSHSKTSSYSDGIFDIDYKNSTDSQHFKSLKYDSSELVAKEDIEIVAGNNINVAASNILAYGKIDFRADKDINIYSLNERAEAETRHENTKMLTSTSSIYTLEKNVNGTVDETAKASILQGGYIRFNGENINIIGSEIAAKEDIELTARTGSINIQAAEEQHTAYEYTETIDIAMTEASDAIENFDEIVKTDNGRLSVKIGGATYFKKESSQEAMTLHESIIKAGGSIKLKADKNIQVLASNLEAKEDIVLNAGEDVIVKEAYETMSEKSKIIEGTAEVTVGVKHQAVAIAFAIKALYESRKQLEDVKKSYEVYKDSFSALKSTLKDLEASYTSKEAGVDYEDIMELKEIIEEMKSDEKYYLLDLTTASVNLTSKVVLLVQEIGAAAASASSQAYGFNVDMQLDIDGVISKAESIAYSAKGSSVVAGNDIVLNAGKNTVVSGSVMQASNNMVLSGENVDIVASESTHAANSSTESAHINVTYSVYGGLQMSADYDNSRGKNESKVYTNSQLSANNINIVSAQDTNINGANIAANGDVTLDVGGNLDIVSKQNRSRSKTSSYGVSVGGSGSSANGGVRNADGSTSMKETVLTTVTSGNIRINTSGNTHVGGALVSGVDSEGHDNGKLALNTGTLSFSNLSDTSFSKKRNMGVSTNVGVSNGVTNNPTPNGVELNINSSNIQLTNSSSYSKAKTMATIGSGSITMADSVNSSDMERLNRDTSTTRKELYNVDRQKGNVDMTLDHRLLSAEGNKKIANDFEHLGSNVQIVAKNLPESTHNNVVLAAIGKVLDNLSGYTGGILPSYGKNGGLIANIPVMLGDKDINQKVIQVVTTDSTYAEQDSENFIPIEESDYYKAADEATQESLKGKGLLVSLNPVVITGENATYQNFTNGMLNDEALAIKNAMDQTGSEVVTINYNPTHGFLGDGLESGVDKVGGTTGVAKQTGEFIYEVTTARGMEGSNFAAHSQGNLLTKAGIEYRLDNGGFMPREYFIDVTKPIDRRDEALPTFVGYGSPVNTEDMKVVVQGSEKDQFKFNGMYTKPNDFVGEYLGNNEGENQIDPQRSTYETAVNLVDLFGDESVHSTYDCSSNKEAACGGRPW